MTSWKEKLALTAQRNRQEIVKAKLDRREMMRLGLLTAGGALIAKAGLSSRAFGQAFFHRTASADAESRNGPAHRAGTPCDRGPKQYTRAHPDRYGSGEFRISDACGA